MRWNLLFFFNSVLLGVGLAMDAFSVSLANGLNETDMRRKKMCGIAGVFAFFQAAMPMIGWICVYTILQYFHAFQAFIPWIALILLVFIGGKMLLEGIQNKDSHTENNKIGITGLLVQGVATSIDALSVGFTIANYNVTMAIVCSLIIALVTFIISIIGLFIGKRLGTRFSRFSTILGGMILIGLGLEIFFTGFFR